MIDDFRGLDNLVIQPNTELPYSFTVTVCSAADANDGAIPYGTDVTSVTATAETIPSSGAAEANTEIFNGEASVSDNVITVPLK